MMKTRDIKKLRGLISLALVAAFFSPVAAQAGPGEEISYWLDQTVNVFECGRDRISSFMPSRNFTTDRDDTYSIDLNYDYDLNMIKISVQGAEGNKAGSNYILDKRSDIERKLDMSLGNNPDKRFLSHRPFLLPLNTGYSYTDPSVQTD